MAAPRGGTTLRVVGAALALVLAGVVAASPALARGSGLYDMSALLRASPVAPTTPAPAPAWPAPGTPTAAPVTDQGTDDDLLLNGASPADEAADETYSDWAEPVNRVIFDVNDVLYTIFLDPFAQLYRIVVPEVARDGVSNMAANLKSPVVLANDLLQGEVTRAWETTQRFVVNSTLGVGGIVDVADRWLDIPPHSEDFGQTLAVWGVPDGGYLVLPLLGPSSPRDAVGFVAESFVDPLNLYLNNTNREEFVYARTGVEALVTFESVVDELDDLKETSVDYYAAVRSLHRQQRQGEIANGAPTALPDL